VPDLSAALWKAIIGRRRLLLIAGPCVVESEALCMRVADKLVGACRKLGITYVFKASFDKANRTSGKSFRGPGIDEGLRVLAKVREYFGVPLLTDVHTEAHVASAAGVVDILQIPAFLCRQTDLIEASARTGRIVNIKKGQFLSPAEMGNVLAKAREAGGRRLLVTERGTTFGYNNLVADMRSMPIMKRFGCPVIFDATHSVQLPGGGGDKSGGQREFAPVLARCALAAGADGLFIETHPDPDRALSEHDSAGRNAEAARRAAQGARGGELTRWHASLPKPSLPASRACDSCSAMWTASSPTAQSRWAMAASSSAFTFRTGWVCGFYKSKASAWAGCRRVPRP
jgi:2-dehydro-3-deoxyphosphooctonate aldolase (KDO 8-P synthase)